MASHGLRHNSFHLIGRTETRPAGIISLVGDQTSKVGSDRFKLIANPLFLHLDPFLVPLCPARSVLKWGTFDWPCQVGKFVDIGIAWEIVGDIGRQG